MIRKVYRGSRKHVLDLISQNDFFEIFNNLLKGSGATVSDIDVHIPKGYTDSEEREIRDFGPKYLAEQVDWAAIRKWWPDQPAKSPQWDLLITCEGKSVWYQETVIGYLNCHQNE